MFRNAHHDGPGNLVVRTLIGYLLTGGTIDARPGSVEVFDGTLSHRLPTSGPGCGSLMVCVPSWTAAGLWLKRGLLSSK
ncbi:hypothetical protein LX88_004489 [Lentzea californiensis]|nr:hypothetical protein [Lentzea californiensis]